MSYAPDTRRPTPERQTELRTAHEANIAQGKVSSLPRPSTCAPASALLLGPLQPLAAAFAVQTPARTHVPLAGSLIWLIPATPTPC
jgi:hypothetical protein